jgi:hypothetical protein
MPIADAMSIVPTMTLDKNFRFKLSSCQAVPQTSQWKIAFLKGNIVPAAMTAEISIKA